MKIIISAGGGGHFSPALAVIKSLPKGTEIILVGRKYSLEGDRAVSYEYQTAHFLGIPFISITTGRFQRRFTRYTVPSLLKFPLGILQSFFLLQRQQPDIVLSFGGYVSLPVTIAAWILRIPIVIHEQTLGIGLTNKITSILAQKICISWETSQKYFPKSKTILTGNPIREEVIYPQKTEFLIHNPLNLPVVYVTGGSSGSHQVNVLIEGCIQRLLAHCVVIHQTGDSQQFFDNQRLVRLQQGLSKETQQRYVLTKFIHINDIGSVLRRADLVISRAGVNTITELLFLNKPALLIPLPVSQENEQQKNALFFTSLGLGEMVMQDSLSSEKLYNLITHMLGKIKIYKMPLKEKNTIKSDAAQHIIHILQTIISNK